MKTVTVLNLASIATALQTTSHLKTSQWVSHAFQPGPKRLPLLVPSQCEAQMRLPSHKSSTGLFAQTNNILSLSLERKHEQALALAESELSVLNGHVREFQVDRMPLSQQQALFQKAFAPTLPDIEWIASPAAFLKANALISLAAWTLESSEAAEQNSDEDPKRLNQKLTDHPKLPELIQSVASFERQEHQLGLLAAYEQLATGSPERHQRFCELTGSLSRYGLMPSMLVFNMLNKTDQLFLTKAEQQTILNDFGNKGLKNAFKLSKVLDFLFEMEKAPLKEEVRSQLLRATSPSMDVDAVDKKPIGKKQMLPKLLRNINLMQVVLQLSNQRGDRDYASMLQTIETIQTPSDLEKAIESLGLVVLGKGGVADSGIAESTTALAGYLAQDDRASDLLVWASKQRAYAQELGGHNNQAWVGRVADWLMGDAEKGKERYQYHQVLDDLKQRNPTAYQRWCERESPSFSSTNHLTITPRNLMGKMDVKEMYETQPAVDPEFDIAIDMDPSETSERVIELSHETGWRAAVTSDVQTIFRCGTLLPGSCQHVGERGSLNQGLIGYLVGGKMAAFWQTGAEEQADKLLARNMLFLGWDPRGAKHVVVMASNMYSQPDCDEGHRAVLKMAAQEYADWLGLELFDSYRNERDMGVCPTRGIVIPLSAPTYFDGIGVRSDDIAIEIDDKS